MNNIQTVVKGWVPFLLDQINTNTVFGDYLFDDIRTLIDVPLVVDVNSLSYIYKISDSHLIDYFHKICKMRRTTGVHGALLQIITRSQGSTLTKVISDRYSGSLYEPDNYYRCVMIEMIRRHSSRRTLTHQHITIEGVGHYIRKMTYFLPDDAVAYCCHMANVYDWHAHQSIELAICMDRDLYEPSWGKEEIIMFGTDSVIRLVLLLMGEMIHMKPQPLSQPNTALVPGITFMAEAIKVPNFHKVFPIFMTLVLDGSPKKVRGRPACVRTIPIDLPLVVYKIQRDLKDEDGMDPLDFIMAGFQLSSPPSPTRVTPSSPSPRKLVQFRETVKIQPSTKNLAYGEITTYNSKTSQKNQIIGTTEYCHGVSIHPMLTRSKTCEQLLCELGASATQR